MVRIALVFAFLAGLIVSAIPAAAQDATPPSGASSEPVTIFNTNVQPIGEIAITDIVDPFEDYDLANSEPTRGYHWVKVSVSLTAGDQPISGGSFQLIDDSGFVTYQAYVSRSSESTTAEPDFYASDLQPGTGDNRRHLLRGLQRGRPRDRRVCPGIGPNHHRGGSSGVRCRVRVTSSAMPLRPARRLPMSRFSASLDPIEDFDSSSAPQRGFRYVGVAVSITNTSSNPFYADSSRFSINDREGFNYFSFTVYRTPEGEAAFPTLQYGEIAAGATVTGIVSFELINGATVAEVLFTPNSDRRFRLAEFGPDDEMTPPDLAAVPTPTPAATVDPACAEALTWNDRSRRRSNLRRRCSSWSIKSTTIRPSILRHCATGPIRSVACQDDVESWTPRRSPKRRRNSL